MHHFPLKTIADDISAQLKLQRQLVLLILSIWN